MKNQKIMLDFAMNNLADSVARLTKDGELRPSAIPGLSLFRRTESSESHIA